MALNLLLFLMLTTLQSASPVQTFLLDPRFTFLIMQILFWVFHRHSTWNMFTKQLLLIAVRRGRVPPGTWQETWNTSVVLVLHYLPHLLGLSSLVCFYHLSIHAINSFLLIHPLLSETEVWSFLVYVNNMVSKLLSYFTFLHAFMFIHFLLIASFHFIYFLLLKITSLNYSSYI